MEFPLSNLKWFLFLSCQPFLLRLLLGVGSKFVRKFQFRRNGFAKRDLWFLRDQLDVAIKLESGPCGNEGGTGIGDRVEGDNGGERRGK